jgi:hypothetical protein
MIVAPRDQPTPRCPTCGTVMALFAIFLRPEVLTFRCNRCEETVALVEGEPHAVRSSVGLGRSDPTPSVSGQT